MKKKSIIILFFVLFILPVINLSASEDECDKCKKNPGECCDEYPYICEPPPGNDHADDNFSFSSFISEFLNKTNSIGTVSILKKGYWKAAEKLFYNFSDNINLVEIIGNLKPPLVIIPSGALFGKKNDTTFKYILQQYVSNGGILIIFGQQHGIQIENLIPVPAGEQLKVYGWREDQSCLKNSVYFDSIHPVLSSSGSQLVDAGVDGYFVNYPANTTILLQRVTNREPALIMYPYGNGYVILTSIFSDWAYAHSQTSISELNIVRDLVTFCKDPNSPIPMFDLSQHPAPEINLEVKVKNNSEETATRMVLKVHTPNRDRVLYEIEQNISLTAGAEMDVPVTFTLPEVTPSEHGIFHSDYELYNPEAATIQLFTESTTGRFAVYKITKTYTPSRNYSVWVTAKKDFFMWNEQADLELHVKNYSDNPITMDWYYDWSHAGHHVLPQITVPGNSRVDYPIEVDPPQRNLVFGGSLLEMFWVWHRTADNADYGAFGKGIRVSYPRTYDHKVVINPNWVKTGDPITYSITTRNRTRSPLEDTAIKVFLEKRQWPEYQFSPIAVVYDNTHILGPMQGFSYTGSYTPAELLTSGMYQLRMEVTHPDGSKRGAAANFSVTRSYISARIKPIPGASTTNNSGIEKYLMVNQSYPFEVILRNLYTQWGGTAIPVSNASFTTKVEAENGDVIFTKTIENMSLPKGAYETISQPFTFNPTVQGKYYLKVHYEDETGTRFDHTADQFYTFRNDFDMTTSKVSYKYGETIGVSVAARGMGNFKLKVDCSAEVFSEERSITLSPDNNNSITEYFEIPTTLANSWGGQSIITVEMESTDPSCSGNSTLCKIVKGKIVKREKIKVEESGAFGQLNARLGSPIDFDLNIKALFGFAAPIPGQLKLSCTKLNYEDIQPVTINPAGDNPFSYDVPVPAAVDAGTYYIQAVLTVNEHALFSGVYPIDIPAPEITFSAVPYNVTCGDSFTLQYRNTGGKDGNFDITVKIYDDKGCAVVNHNQLSSIPAGANLDIPVTIPIGLKSGRYSFYTTTKEHEAAKTWTNYSGMNITGISVDLNAYTLKEKYFNNETISGKAEITAGVGDIENGAVRARIIRHLESSGIEEDKPGDYISYNLIESGFSSDTKLYLSTDKGLVEYDKATGNVNVLYNFEYYNCRNIYQTAGGEIWVGTGGGVFRRDSTGTWQQYTSADGLTDNWIYDIIEADLSGTPAVWVANRGGISVFSFGSWTSFTTVDGLPSNRVYALAKDDTGAVWASTSGGVVRYNDTSTTFESVSAPFGTAGVPEKNLTNTNDGSVWMVYSHTVYRYHSGVWQTWTRDELYPDNTIYIRQIEAIGDDVWIKSDFWEDDNKHQVLIRYDGVFTTFTNTEIQGLTGLDYYAIMPGNGDDAYFTCEFGFMEYNDGTWSDKEIAVDVEKLAGEIRSMKVDSNGTIWAGTDWGLAMYDGGKWINYASTPGNLVLLEVNHMTVDTSNRVYGFTLDGVIKITTGVLEMIEFTTELYNLGFECYPDTKIAVDTTGKVWLGRRYTFYHDGEWHKYEGVRYVSAMENHRVNGIWVGSWNDYSEFHLQHIKNDLTLDDYTASNSDLIPWEKDRLYMDGYGILWIKHEPDSWDGIRNLQSFDGTNWINYTGYEGFPQYGVVDFVRDGNGNLIVVDRDGNLHTLENNTFVPGKEDIHYINSLVYSNGQLYYAGGEPIFVGGEVGYEYPRNFVTLGSTAGLTEEEVWRQTYNLNLSAGESTDIDLLTGMNLSAGSYVLKTTLLSPLDQELAGKDDAFIVRENDISIAVSGDNGGNPYIKAGSTVNTTVEILNNTPDDYPTLRYVLKKQSPSGTVVTVRDLMLSVAAGGSYTDSLTFSESETGTWRLTAEIYEESSGGGETPGFDGEGDESSGTLLSQSEMILQVAEPVVSMEILSPQFAGDDPFDIKVKLLNEGNIEAQCHLTVSGGTTDIDETITLKPLEERIFSLSDTIAADRNYTIALSGDVERMETKTVRYGYVENFNFNVLPSYREGAVSIAYQISNTGGLAFRDDLHFKLYAIGGTVPLYIVDKTYNLYPVEEALFDGLEFSLAPGNYRLTYQSTKNPLVQEALFAVQPSGTGVVTFIGSTLYPVGLNDVKYRISNTDTAAGSIPVSIVVTNSQSQPIFSETRYYYLQPDETRDDAVYYEFSQKGNYTLSITGSKVTIPVQTTFQVLNLDEASAEISVGALEADHIPVQLTVTNSGINTFAGTLVMEVDGVHYEEPVTVAGASSFTETFEFATASLSAGTREFKSGVYDTAGNEISYTDVNIVISGADIVISELPENLEIDAGSYTPVTLKVKNEGHVRGEAILKVTAFDTLNDERDIALEPGEEVEIEGFVIDAAADLPTGNYPFNYTLSGSGVENGVKAGNFNFKVNGISLDVDASFDSDYYKVGETAELTINVTTQSANDAPLEAMVNWGEYSEKQTFNLSTGSQQLVFNIPVDEYREDKVFYGIYHEGGKGIHLNDIYLRFGGDTNMVLDKQVYQPGDIVHAVFTGIEGGELTATCFDETHTVPVSSSVLVDFAVPGVALGGTYGVSWAFTPADTSHEPLSGSINFDVSGLVVKVAHSGLEKGKYVPGETIKATYTFESNRDDTLAMRCWTTFPTGEWEYLGENSVTVSVERHVNAISSYTFNTAEAGTHNLVYGLYREDQLVVSGSMSFDVGDAVLMGITTDHFEYKEGNELVNVKVDYFGEGTAQMELYLDEELVDQRSLTISGVGSTGIPLASTQVSGGSHSLKVILTKDGLTSTKSTSFIYGTHLPDLTVTLIDTDSEGLDYSYTTEVTNSGKTASTATSLIFTDNETAVETISIPALQSGESHEATFNWSGSGKAGSHEFVFEVDNSNTVKEFSETNNSLTFTQEVPVIFYTLEVEPVIWPANSDITIISRLINNQNSVTPMILNLSITNDNSGEVIFERNCTEELPAFGSKTISDIFNTGVYPAGEYTLTQTLSSDTVTLEKSISILIEITKAIDATLGVQPQTITADIDVDVELTMTLTNAGNVPLEDEILVIDVFNKDSEEIVKSEELMVSIPLAEQITETKIMALNLMEGNYEIRLKYLEELLTAADLITVGGIEGEKEIAIQPRVLVMNLHLLGSRSSQVEFLAYLLQSQEIEYETGHLILDSYVKLHKGHSNVNIVLGNLIGRNLGDELKERVWRGEGLILVCDKPINSPELMDFLGINVRPIKGKDREKYITLLPCELGSGGEVELEKKNKLMLKKEREDVIIVGQTQQKKHPVLAWRKYGNGHILVMTVPLQFKAGIREISQLLVNAVSRFSKDVYTQSDLTRIIPIKLSITNKASEEKSLVVKELLPYGVEGYGYDPEPEEGEDKELKWNLKVPAAGEVTISYWLKLPDQINIYDIKTEIYEGETLRDELSITFEVSQTVLSRIDELIVEIESIYMDASGGDVRFLRKAVNKLQKIRNRIGDSLSQQLVNLLDSVEAAANLGKVKNIDVSPHRLKTQNIMIIMGRRFYEKVKAWGASRLIPFSGMIAGD